MQQAVKIKTAAHGQGSPSLLIIYTGGTFGMAYDKKGVLLQPFNFTEILEHLPELNRFEMELTFMSMDQPMDSSNLNELHWIEMAAAVYQNYEQYDGFVILHGTDTMAYSASALSFLLENLNKPVIFTGAQLPINVARTDARENFITSLEIASARKNGMPLLREVCIYFDYDLLRGNRSKKTQSNQFDAFVSENYPLLAKAGVSIEYNEAAIASAPSTGTLKAYTKLDNNLATLKLFPGLQEKNLRPTLDIPELKAVIVETYGSGNAPDVPWLIKSLEKEIAKGLIVYNVSQCVGGKVIQGKYETSRKLKEIGVLSGGNITFESALAKMMFVLAQDKNLKEKKIMLESNLRGELDNDRSL